MPTLKCKCGAVADFSDDQLRQKGGKRFRCSRCGRVAKLPATRNPEFVPRENPTYDRVVRGRRSRISFDHWLVLLSFLVPGVLLVLFIAYQLGILRDAWNGLVDVTGLAIEKYGPAVVRHAKSWIMTILVWGPVAAFVFFDARRRKVKPAILLAVAVFFFGIIAFPLYFARRPLLPGEIRDGGHGFNVLKGAVLVWTFVVAWIFSLTYILVPEVQVNWLLTVDWGRFRIRMDSPDGRRCPAGLVSKKPSSC